MSGCLIDSEIESEFKKQGVKDSKKLTPRRREILAEIIKEKALAYEILVIHPKEIDSRTNSGINLNRIEAIKAAEIINKISETKKIFTKERFSEPQKSKISAELKGIEKIKVVVDCPSPNIEKWKNTLKSYVNNKEKFDFVVEHKADVNHIACSAASIIGKSEREKQIEQIKKQIGIDFGSGYSSDPYTMNFLKNYYKKHKKDGIFRETWGTIKNHKAKKQQKKLLDYNK